LTINMMLLLMSRNGVLVVPLSSSFLLPQLHWPSHPMSPSVCFGICHSSHGFCEIGSYDSDKVHPKQFRLYHGSNIVSKHVKNAL
jgi:hypothetical protein